MSNNNKTPAIRFKGFTDTWEQRKLGEISESFEYGLNAAATEYDGKHKYIRITDIDDSTHLFLQDNLTSPDVDFSTVDDYLLQKGDVLFARTGASVGKTYIYRPSDGDLYFAGFLIRAKIKSDYDADFIFQNTLTDNYDSYIRITSQRSGQPGVNAQEYANFALSVPCLAEQKKIGAYFTNLDNLITLHQRKYDKLIQFKAAMLKKMFPQNGANKPEIRFRGFTDAWEQRKLGELVVIERGGSPRPIDDYITDSPDGLNWVKIGDAPEQGNYITSTKEKIRPEGLSKTREVHPGDLILSNSMSFGKPYIMAIDGCIHDGWLSIKNTNNVFDLKFLCVLLGTDQMLTQYKSMAAGSTVNNLNKELVGNTTVTYPSVEEQRTIGQFFEEIENLITLHQRKCDKYKSIKSGLIRKLFP